MPGRLHARRAEPGNPGQDDLGATFYKFYQNMPRPVLGPTRPGEPGLNMHGPLPPLVRASSDQSITNTDWVYAIFLIVIFMP